MAKLTALDKEEYAINREVMDSDYDYAFLFNREAGISAMAIFTGIGHRHFRVVVSYCGPNDEFKKKIGFTECVDKLIGNDQGVILPANGMGIEDCLIYFLESNFPYDEWEEML